MNGLELGLGVRYSPLVRQSNALLSVIPSFQIICMLQLSQLSAIMSQAEFHGFTEWRRISWNLSRTRRPLPPWPVPCHRRLACRRSCRDSDARRIECTPSLCQPAPQPPPEFTHARTYRKTSSKRPRRLLEHWPPAFINAPMFPVYVNFTFHVNLQHLYLLG